MKKEHKIPRRIGAAVLFVSIAWCSSTFADNGQAAQTIMTDSLRKALVTKVLDNFEKSKTPAMSATTTTSSLTRKTESSSGQETRHRVTAGSAKQTRSSVTTNKQKTVKKIKAQKPAYIKKSSGKTKTGAQTKQTQSTLAVTTDKTAPLDTQNDSTGETRTKASQEPLDQKQAGVTPEIDAPANQEAQTAVVQENSSAVADAEDETAEEKESILPQFLHPYLWAGTGYNDNLFLLKDKTGAMVNTLTPGIKLLWGTLDNTAGTNRLEFDAGASLYQFVSHSELNQALPFANAYFRLGRNKHSLAVKHNYKRNYKPASSMSLGAEGFENYTSNVSLISWGSGFNRVGFDIDYERSDYQYEKEYRPLSSSIQNVISPSIYYQAFPKTRVFFGYNYGFVDYPKSASDSRDNSFNRYWVGIKDKITEKTTGVIQAGFEDRTYKDSENDRSGIAMKMDLTFQYTPKLAFILKAAQGSKDPSYPRETFNEGTDFSLHSVFHLTEKVSIDGGFDYANDKYKSGRKDNIYAFSTKLSFAYHRWLIMRTGYRFEQRTSNISEAEFNNNILTIESGLVF